MLNIKYKLLILLLTGLFFVAEATPKITNGPKRMSATNSIGSLAKSAYNHLNPAKTILSINNITSWVERNGFFHGTIPVDGTDLFRKEQLE